MLTVADVVAYLTKKKKKVVGSKCLDFTIAKTNVSCKGLFISAQLINDSALIARRRDKRKKRPSKMQR